MASNNIKSMDYVKFTHIIGCTFRYTFGILVVVAGVNLNNSGGHALL
jgi:hypothetical protein